MLTLRFLPLLRTSLWRKSTSRMMCPVSEMFNSFPILINEEPTVRNTIQRAHWFSTTATIYARRKKDDVDINASEQYEDEEEEESEEDSDQSDQEKIRLSLQQYNLPKGYRIIIKHLASLRLDLICSAGTGMGRSAIEDEFYGSKLRVNGEKSLKKAQQVKESDIIDLVVSRVEGAKYISKRIVVYKVFDDRSLKNKVKVCLLAWRQGIEVDGSAWN